MPERGTLEFTHGKKLNRICAMKDETRELQDHFKPQSLCHGGGIHILQILQSLKLHSIGRGMASVY